MTTYEPDPFDCEMDGFCGEMNPNDASWYCSLEPDHPGRHVGHYGMDRDSDVGLTWGVDTSSFPFTIRMETNHDG